MAGTEPGEAGDLESVARLVRMSETAPMPRIDGAPRAQRPVTDGPAVPEGVFGGALDDRSGSAAAQLAAAGGPATAELSGLDELLDGASAETAPSVGRRPVRSLIVAGAAVVAFGGLGVWALWPSSAGDAAGEPVPPPAVPSSAPPTAITTLTASPVPPPATADVPDSTIRATSKETAPPSPPPVTSPAENSDDVPPGSYQRQRNDHRKPPHRHGQE
ncbi:hypothetical protein ATK36_1188 [Amycolatopsis sulphurea]|uniref:Uncharacterized protein n=1 Tax=Amycolatopsis sulphurea TaxID=76022 RepID=A0A2A9G1R4_9PSEU|nr:hypothetical protein [Amycolatopsis sulphurea]PFG57594.1 hypothetical protein ATK36_1188 [Amycolatopsis sulphurea]